MPLEQMLVSTLVVFGPPFIAIVWLALLLFRRSNLKSWFAFIVFCALCCWWFKFLVDNTSHVPR